MIKIGDEFGRWTVISNKIYVRKNHHLPVSKDFSRKCYRTCVCACGNKKKVLETSLLRKSSKSCGCLRKEYLTSKDPWKTEFNIYKKHIKKVKPNTIFDLNINQFKDLSISNCFYCGIEPNIKTKTGNKFKNGLDRLNNNLGYTEENTVSCCSDCNFMKSSLNIDDFYKLINYIYSFTFNKICLVGNPEPLFIKKKSLISSKVWEVEFSRMKKDIAKRGREFSLELEHFVILVTSTCYYCGSLPSKKTHVGMKFRNGIDRINNNIGYIDNNMVTCCWNCNKMKGKLNQDTFLNKVQKIIHKGIK